MNTYFQPGRRMPNLFGFGVPSYPTYGQRPQPNPAPPTYPNFSPGLSQPPSYNDPTLAAGATGATDGGSGGPPWGGGIPSPEQQQQIFGQLKFRNGQIPWQYRRPGGAVDWARLWAEAQKLQTPNQYQLF